MKYSKKALTAIAFIVGAATFITTAFADIAVGSGYDKLKNAIKNTSEKMTNGLDNYSIEIVGIVKDNDSVIYKTNSLTKVDIKAGKKEDINSDEYTNKSKSYNYGYFDEEMTIYKYGNTDKYRVIKRNSKNKENLNISKDPFKEKGAAEVEKVVDAVVGNLKEYVQVKEIEDNRKEYSGTLTETQIPAVANALSSFMFKRQFSNSGQYELPVIESDIFIKNVSGSALENKSGVLENLTGEVLFYGKDKDNALHEMSFQFVGKIYDIGNTKVERPDMTGKDIIEEKESKGPVIDKKYEGKYIQNIVIEKESKLIKIGERVFEIINASEGKIKGRYYETYKPGFESYQKKIKEFAFESSVDNMSSKITYKSDEGKDISSEMHISSYNEIYFYFGNKDNGEFIRDYEE